MKGELDTTKRRVQAKLTEYKKGYAQQFEVSNQQKNDDIRDLETRYEDL